MKNILKTILFILLFVSANGQNFYVNGDLTTSTNTGTSWADAWESFADINWASLGAGDTLFISGGTDSTVYTSNGITLIEFDSAYAYAGGNEYIVYEGGVTPEPPFNWVTGYTRVFPNDDIYLRVTSSANYSTTVSSTLTVGIRTDTFSVTTEAESPAPTTNTKLFKGNNGIIIKDSTNKFIKTQ